MSVLTRILRAFRRYGPAGAARRGARAVRLVLFVRERHYWYARPVSPGAPRAGETAFELRRASAADLHYLDPLPTVEVEQAQEFLARGASLWIVLADGGQPAFACWTFRRATPLPVVQGGWQPIPEDMAGLAFSLTHPGFRGRGIAPWAWEAIATELAQDGIQTIVTEVEAENAASRRAVAKAGFAEVAAADILRIGPYRHVAHDIFDAGATTFLR